MSRDGADIRVVAIDGIETEFAPAPWAFAEEARERIAANWTVFTRRSPKAFDGRVLLAREPRIETGVFRGRYFETAFSAFLAWRDFGYPDLSVFNVFAMAALRAEDGAFLLGQMGEGTANPGRIYFPAGTPDPSDIVGARVDLGASALRELHEETGLTPDEIAVGNRWIAVFEGQKIALMRDVVVKMPAEAARDAIKARLAALHEEELSDIVVVRGPADIRPDRMPGFTSAYLTARFAEGG